ncbi:hypothetical protein GCM10009826_34500 [Humibacillus xanthopallidus]
MSRGGGARWPSLSSLTMIGMSGGIASKSSHGGSLGIGTTTQTLGLPAPRLVWSAGLGRVGRAERVIGLSSGDG